MKHKAFLAINLDDFHANQNEAETNTQIKFISAKSLSKAEQHMKTLYPDTPWVVISKKYFDEHIVYRTIKDWFYSAYNTINAPTDELNALMQHHMH